MAIFSAIQDDVPWEDPAAGGRVLDVLSGNPFAPVSDMLLDTRGKWRAFDRAVALKSFDKAGKKRAAVNLRGKRPSVYASLARDPLRNTGQLELADAAVFDQPAEISAAYLSELCAAMPGVDSAFAGAEFDNADYNARHGLEPIPLCFRESLRWMHVIAPKSYGPLFEVADLQALPAKDVAVAGDGTVTIRFYAHPKDFEDPAVTARLAEASKVIAARRRDFR